ncbi:MAG TPA: SDR family NAD(P)-dependent oxidoreductase [Polyangia bacterium]|nr:SDR family NAD(P)-dependent oxidoreductase [Polyangia bacterium]
MTAPATSTASTSPASSLAGKVAVVTGSSRGIGRAIARALAGAGATVAGCALHAAPGIEVCDVRRADDVERFARAVEARFGAPHVLVNNAGTVARAPLEALAEEAWDDVVDANLKGTYLVTRAFLPGMRAHGARARIVNVASISGRLGTAGLTAYCAAKHGVVGLTRALAEELRPAGIPVNAVCPGSVDTDMLRVGMPGARPQMSPEDVAGVVLYLAAAAPAALTGSCVDVFG